MSTVSLLRKIGESEHTQEAREGAGFDLLRIERAVREILLAVGEDPDRDGLRDTPHEFYSGWITHDIVGPFKGGPGTAAW
jgi:GTP cyclohydrolase I